MSTEQMFCPLVNNGVCKKQKCMWWIAGIKKCAVNSLAQSLDAIAKIWGTKEDENVGDKI